MRTAFIKAQQTENGYIGISLQSRNHQGEGLKFMVDWINDRTDISFMRIGLSDTLNRFNYQYDGMTDLQARQAAVEMGDQWVTKNLPILSRLKMSYELVRWDTWEQDRPEIIAENKLRYMDAAAHDPVFKSAIAKDVNNFTYRRHGLLLQDAPADLVTSSVDYLIEELAVYEEIYRDFPNTTFYPGKQLACFEVLRNREVTGLSETIPHTAFQRIRIPANNLDWLAKPTSRQAGL